MMKNKTKDLFEVLILFLICIFTLFFTMIFTSFFLKSSVFEHKLNIYTLASAFILFISFLVIMLRYSINDMNHILTKEYHCNKLERK